MAKRFLLFMVGRTSVELAKERGDYDRWFREGLGVGEAMEVVRVVEGEALVDFRPYDAIVITGSSAMVTDREPWSVATAELLREAHAHGTYLLGVCYGHQLLADALGGKVDWNPNGRQIGTVDAPLTDEGRADALLGGIGDPLVVQTSHSQCVLEPPPGAVVLATSPKDASHALRFGPRSWGVQFHPEFDDHVSTTYIRERAERIRGEGGDPEALLRAVRASGHGTAILRRFAGIVGG
ncbi:MAG: glutamine amidotransferase [Polyangiales bacterium]